jgi:protein-S-isoprenylcysteine O-methyltransferase Ste14
VLIVGGVPLAFHSLGIFRTARTTTVPFEKPSKLVTRGPYRFTRNPMYLGLALIYLGVAGLQAQIWPIMSLLLLIIYIDRVVIPVEESRLREVFGKDYERYCTQVRRWI